MPRIRSIHYDAWKSEKLARASDGAERCYWRIHPYMDDQGRGEDHPKLIAATCFPLRDEVTAEVIDGWLCELDRLGLVVRYEAAGLRLVQIMRWSNYQHPQKPKRSDFPAPPAHSDTSNVTVRDTDGTGSARSGGEKEEEGSRRLGLREPRGTTDPTVPQAVDISSRRAARELAERAAKHGGPA